METDNNVLDLHLFVCTNQRELPRTGCGDIGSGDLHTQLKKEIKARNLDLKIRVNKSGCLDQCEKGPVMVLYPQNKWFFHVTVADLPAIIDEVLKT